MLHKVPPILITRFLLVFSSVLFVCSAFSSDKQDYKIEKWTTEHGLPQNTITAIIQTQDSYIWLGTFGGLVRFDGIRFKIFNTANTPTLKNQRVNALYEDRHGTLWIGSDAGEVVRYQNGKFQFFDILENNKFINSFFLDSKDSLWIGTEKGLVQYSFDSNKIFHKKQINLPFSSKVDDANSVISINEDLNEVIWFATGDRVFHLKNDTLREFSGQNGLPLNYEKGSFSAVITNLNIDKQGVLRVATTDGILRFKDNRFIFDIVNIQVPENKPHFSKGLNNNLFVNFNNGLIQLIDNKWVKFPLTEFRETFFRTIMIDRENNIWAGTIGNGLWRLNKRYVDFLGENEGLPNGEAYSLIEDQEGRIWLGGRGLWIFQDGKLMKVPMRETYYNYYTALNETSDGVVWIGGGGGLNSFYKGKSIDYKDKFLSVIKSDQMMVKAIFEDSKKVLWFGMDKGVVRLENDKYKHFTTENGLVNNTVHFIIEDRSGAIWFGTLGGVSRYKDNTFTNYTTDNGLSDNTVRAIYEDRNGAIWFGTYGGGLLRLKDNHFSVITTRNGLFDDVISRIIVDEYDNFWMLGNRGIFVANRQSLNDVADGKIRQITCRSYGVADGMLTNEGSGGNMYAGWRTRDGKFWFPTIHGFAIITQTPPNTFLPPTVIEEASIEDNSIDITNTIEINPKQQNLEIKYTGLSFIKSELIRFKYKMEGFDSDWIEVGTRRTAYYSYLPPGDYTFTVIAANSDGVWNAEGTSVKIRVFPAFHQTWWFRLLATMIVATLIYTIYYWRINQLEYEKHKQQEFSKRLLESQEQERKRLAAELHDSLSQNLVIIKNKAQMSLKSHNDKEIILEQIEEIAEAAGESLTEVSEIVQNLRPFQIDRLGFTKAVAGIIKKSSSSKLKIKSRLDEIDGILSPEKEINLFRIIQESINNIIKHSEANEALISIKRSEEIIEIKIKDNGKGFKDTLSINKSKNSGLGLMSINERSRALESHLTIKSNEGDGTELRLLINI